MGEESMGRDVVNWRVKYCNDDEFKIGIK